MPLSWRPGLIGKCHELLDYQLSFFCFCNSLIAGALDFWNACSCVPLRCLGNREELRAAADTFSQDKTFSHRRLNKSLKLSAPIPEAAKTAPADKKRQAQKPPVSAEARLMSLQTAQGILHAPRTGPHAKSSGPESPRLPLSRSVRPKRPSRKQARFLSLSTGQEC